MIIHINMFCSTPKNASISSMFLDLCDETQKYKEIKGKI